MKTMADILRERGKLGPYGPAEEPRPPPPDRPDPAAVRAWAAANNITVGARGLIPAAVLAAYRKRDADVDL